MLIFARRILKKKVTQLKTKASKEHKKIGKNKFYTDSVYQTGCTQLKKINRTTQKAKKKMEHFSQNLKRKINDKKSFNCTQKYWQPYTSCQEGTFTITKVGRFELISLCIVFLERFFFLLGKLLGKKFLFCSDI